METGLNDCPVLTAQDFYLPIGALDGATEVGPSFMDLKASRPESGKWEKPIRQEPGNWEKTPGRTAGLPGWPCIALD